MNITLNGEKKDAPEGLTVLGLLQHLKIQPERVAVELNLNVVKKAITPRRRSKTGTAWKWSALWREAYGASRPCRRE